MGKYREQRRGLAFIGKGGAGKECFTEFSMARLLLGKEKFFLPPTGVCKVGFFLLGSVGYTYGEWLCLKFPPSGLPNSIVNKASFIFTLLHFDGDFSSKSLLMKSWVFHI